MPSHSKDKLNAALAMAGLASQVYAVFAVAVALGGPRTPPGPANPLSPTARAATALRGRCAAIWPDLQLEMGRGRAKANPVSNLGIPAIDDGGSKAIREPPESGEGTV